MASTSLPSPSVHAPSQPSPADTCISCGGVLGVLKLCAGMGQDIHNYNRWYQVCSACNKLFWHGPRTPLEAIPESVQIMFTVNKSLQEDSHAPAKGGLPCTNPTCTGLHNVRCKAHRLSAVEGSSAPSGPPPLPPAPPETGLPYLSLSVPPALPPPLPSLVPLNAIVPLPPPSSVTASPSLSPLPVSGSNQSTTAPFAIVPQFKSNTRSYARPLDEGYAKPWLQRHQAKVAKAALLDAGRELRTKMENIVKVTLWTKAAPEKPTKFQVTTQHAAVLVIVEHASLVTVLQGCSTGVEVFHVGEQEWFAQSLDLPISVPSATLRVLIRVSGLQDGDCLELASEIAAVTGAAKRPRGANSLPSTPQKVRKFSYATSPGATTALSPPMSQRSPSPFLPISLCQVAANPSLAASSGSAVVPPTEISAASTLVVATPGRVVKPLPFPRRYACDMSPGMQQVASINHDVETHFASAFPGTRFVKTTFYRHRAFYLSAQRRNILDAFVNAGQTAQGLWRELVREIERLDAEDRPAPTHGMTSNPSLFPIAPGHRDLAFEDSDSEDARPSSGATQTPYVTYNNALFEWFEGIGTMFSSRWSEETLGINISLSRNPVRQGRRKNIYIMSISEPKKYSGAYIAKAVRLNTLPNGWQEDFKSEWSLQHRETERFARAGDIAALFLFEAGSEKGAHVHDFKFVPTYVVSDGDGSTAWTVQKELVGRCYPSSEDAKLTSFINVTLNAFGHYSLERYGLYFDAYEGIYVNGGALTFYSCKSHTIDSSYTYLEDHGRSYVTREFTSTHVCNSICHALELAPLDISDPDPDHGDEPLIFSD